MMFNNSISFTYFDVLILILVFVLYTVLFNSRTVVRYARNNTIAFAVSLLVLGVVILFLSVQLLYGAQIIS